MSGHQDVYVLLLLILSLHQGLVLGLSSHYYSRYNTTWHQAKAVCEYIGGFLVKFDDMDELTKVISNRAQWITDTPNMYVGCSDLDVEGDFRWLDGTMVSPANMWHAGEPGGGTTQNCGVLYPDGLHDIGCDLAYPFICEINEASEEARLKEDIRSCWVTRDRLNNINETASEKSSIVLGLSSYYYSLYETTWPQAKSDCEHVGGFLVKFDNCAELAEVRAQLDNPNMFVGLSDQDVEGDFRWLDGTQILDSVMWDVNNPGGGTAQNCGALWVDSLNDVPCTNTYPYICEVDEASEEARLKQDIRSCWVTRDLLNNINETASEKSSIVLGLSSYYYSLYETTWPQAKSDCEHVGGFLVKFDNCAELAEVRAQLDNPNMFVGLSDQDVEGDFRWLDGTQILDSVMWHVNNPGGGTAQNCGALWVDSLNDVPCTNTYPYICEVDEASEEAQLKQDIRSCWVTEDRLHNINETATEKSSFVPGLSSHFYSRYQTTWHQAKSDCEHVGGFLVKFDNCGELTEVISNRAQWITDTPNMIVGLSDLDVEGDFRWLDGTQVLDSVMWGPDDPGGGTAQNCGTLWLDGLHDVPCTFTYPYICEVDKASKNARLKKDIRSCWVANDLLRNVKGTDSESYVKCPRDKLYFSPSHWKNSKTWDAANAFCKKANASLAKITSLDEQLMVDRFRLVKQFGYTWIGGTDIVVEGQFTWEDGVPFSWPLFLDSAAPAADSTKNCVATGGTKTWSVAACSTLYPILCEIDVAQAPNAQTCYWQTSSAQSWDNDLLTCQAAGGTLANIRNIQQFERVQKILQLNYYYFGPSDVDVTWDWRYTDGTIMTWSRWVDSQPNHYGGYQPSGTLWFKDAVYKFNDMHATQNYIGLCEKTVFRFRDAEVLHADGSITVECHNRCHFIDGSKTKTWTCGDMDVTHLDEGCICISSDADCYVDHKLLNMALGKTTFASSVTRLSSFTVDRDRAEYDHKCMNTSTVDNPWLIVDLNETLPVSTVVFTAVTADGATSEYQVLVGDTFDAATFNPLTSGYKPCLSRSVSMVEFEVMYVQCERTLVGRYVLIFRREVTNLRVCEVEVYAEPVFQPEKWTCIRPELQGPTGLLNLARGLGPNTYQSSTEGSGDSGGQAYKGLDGNDYGDSDGATGYYSCSHTQQEVQPWWLVDLGQTALITGVVITNSLDCCGDHLNNFKIFVGNLTTSATSFVEADYELCADYCAMAPSGRKYFKCERPIEGNHVAIALVLTGILTLCEVEIYSDINDVTLPSWPANNGLNQRILYDDDDNTCIQLHQLLGLQPFSVEIPWDPTTKTGLTARTGYYHCRQDFYVNVTYTSGLHLGLSVSNQQVHRSASSEYPYVGRNCDIIGKMTHEGVTRIRYACFCEVKCWVYIYVILPRNISDSRLCTINVYD